MTNNSRHQTGAPASQGGQFKSQNRSEADTTLDAGAAAAARKLDFDKRRTDLNASATLMSAVRTSYEKQLVDTMASEMLVKYPNAARALFALDSETEQFVVWEVLDADGVPLPELISDLTETHDLTAEYLDEINGSAAPFEECTGDEMDPHRHIVALNLADRPEHKIFNPADVIGLDKMARSHQTALAHSAAEAIGLIGGYADKNEVEYQLTEDPFMYGFDETIITKLEEKFGGREAALQAIVDTNAWTKVDEQMGENSISTVSEGIHRAVDEAFNS